MVNLYFNSRCISNDMDLTRITLHSPFKYPKRFLVNVKSRRLSKMSSKYPMAVFSRLEAGIFLISRTNSIKQESSKFKKQVSNYV
jgi:hypothetical protein